MGRGTLGNPRIRESRGTKQARQIRALESRVRRLEKQARPAVIYDAGPVMNVQDLKGEQVLLPSRTRLPFTLVEPDEVLERPVQLMRYVLDRMDLRPSQEALNSALTTGLGAIEIRPVTFDVMFKPVPWWRRPRRVFRDLLRRALGAVTPPYGVREARPSLSDDTQ